MSYPPSILSSHTTTRPKKSTTPTSKKIKCVVLGAADAGKTSLLRRYFRETFSATRVPTAGSDFYTKRVQVQVKASSRTNNGEETSFQQQPVLFQMFDTPGKDPTLRRLRDEDQAQHMLGLIDAFCGRIDGVLLVYDMTSSTSFTLLRLWHARWRQKFTDDPSTEIPIMIVGTKRDRIVNHNCLEETTTNESTATAEGNKNSNQRHGRQRSSIPVVQTRDVMGMGSKNHRNFKGKDFRYEYRVDHQVVPSSNTSSVASLTHHNANNTPTSRQRNNAKHNVVASTFSSTAAGAWTQDGNYLDSLLGTEDRSNPDQDMVKLWCMRNNVPHVEVSSAASTEEGGVGVAMDQFLKLVLEHQEQKEQQEEENRQRMLEKQRQQANHSANNSNGSLINNDALFPRSYDQIEEDGNNQHHTTEPSSTIVVATTAKVTTIPYLHPNKELDLLDRYRPKDYSCCFGFCPPASMMRFFRPKDVTQLHPMATTASVPSSCLP